MTTINERVFQMRVIEGKLETLPGEFVEGTHYKVFFFKSPQSYGALYSLGVTCKKTQDTFIAEVECADVTTFFMEVFKDEKDFMTSDEIYKNYTFVNLGCDCC